MTASWRLPRSLGGPVPYVEKGQRGGDAKAIRPPARLPARSLLARSLGLAAHNDRTYSIYVASASVP